MNVTISVPFIGGSLSHLGRCGRQTSLSCRGLGAVAFWEALLDTLVFFKNGIVYPRLCSFTKTFASRHLFTF